MLDSFTFPFRFDPARLRAGLEQVTPADWSPHFNEGDYGGTWRGAALRSASGTVTDLLVHPPIPGAFANTPLLDRCPYFREVLAAFPCPLKSVRLLSLEPGAFIREHSDGSLDYEDGEIRIHVPIQTNPAVEFYVSGDRLQLEEGGCYYLNVNLPHRVTNGGTTPRIHLVIDAEVDGWVHEQFRRADQENWRTQRCAPPQQGFDAFRGRLFGSPELIGQLSPVRDQADFIGRTIELCRHAGYRANEADVTAACRPCESGVKSETLRGWTPVNVTFEAGAAEVEWIWTGSMRLTEPFFEESIRLARRLPFTRLIRRRTPLDAADAAAAMAPTGFIYHVSRCGSTLIAQMLAAIDRAVSISEAPAIDHVLQAGLTVPDLPREQQIRWFRQIVAALGQRRAETESLYFLKLDSWHIHRLPLIREAFPDVPWIFLSRNIDEVIASQLRRPGLLGAPGAMDARALGLTLDDVTSHTREQWCARVIGDFLRAAESFRNDPAGLFVDYGELPHAVWGRIASHFRVDFSGQEIARMREAARFDTKNPSHLWPPNNPELRP
jgi:hypothetical protein